MKAFIASVVVAIGLAVGAYAVLNGVQVPAEAAFATSGVRL
jgi:hypothetical protein